MQYSGYLSLVICLVGLLIYALSVRPKAEKVGWHMFFWGLIFLLYCNCGAILHVGVTGR